MRALTGPVSTTLSGEEIMRSVFILATCVLLIGCSQRTDITSQQTASPSLAKFEKEFRDLFISDTLLNYNNAHALLSWLDHEAKLSEADNIVVCSELWTFLHRKSPKELDPDAGLTGIAPPEAVLRAYAVGLLGQFGNQRDILFLSDLGKLDQNAISEELRYPSWNTICTDAIQVIKERNR
jgi:hypothetical protein